MLIQEREREEQDKRGLAVFERCSCTIDADLWRWQAQRKYLCMCPVLYTSVTFRFFTSEVHSAQVAVEDRSSAMQCDAIIQRSDEPAYSRLARRQNYLQAGNAPRFQTSRMRL
jgi:hypothetical protein